MVNFLAIMKITKGFRKMSSSGIESLVGQSSLCFIGLVYCVALALPLHNAVSEFVAKTLLFKNALHFLSEERLRLYFCERDLFFVVPAANILCEMAVEAFTEIVRSVPIQLVQEGLCIVPSLPDALNRSLVIVCRSDSANPSKFLCDDKPVPKVVLFNRFSQYMK